MSAQDTSPTITLTLGGPETLAEVQKWAALAELLGIPSTSTVDLSIVRPSLSVTAYLAQVEWPQDDEDSP